MEMRNETEKNERKVCDQKAEIGSERETTKNKFKLTTANKQF